MDPHTARVVVNDSLSSSSSSSGGDNMTYMSDEEVERYIRMFANQGGSIFDAATQTALIVAFAVLIVFGALGNGLVCYVVARHAHMRTPRNIFITNLAISDLTLCLFTQPFNLMKVSMSVWKLADFMCKLIPLFAGTNVFVSTISITAIALDRFQVIVYPTKDSMKKVGGAVALISIWLISFLMASPLLVFNIIETGDYNIKSCLENRALYYEKVAYSLASMVFQYIVPIAMVSVAHARICKKLKYRMVNQQPVNSAAAVNSPYAKRKNEREAQRKRKTNLLLVMIAVVFACAWMPLNVANVLADFMPNVLKDNDLLFPVCHLLVLLSACTNPVLYGWLNDNFRREFIALFCCRCCLRLHKLPCCRGCTCPQPPRASRASSGAGYSRPGPQHPAVTAPAEEQGQGLGGTLLALEQSNLTTSHSTLKM